MANLSVEEPYALMRARTGLWEPWVGNDPGPPGQIRHSVPSVTQLGTRVGVSLPTHATPPGQVE